MAFSLESFFSSFLPPFPLHVDSEDNFPFFEKAIMDSIYPLVVTEAAAARHGTVRVWAGRQHPFALGGNWKSL